MGVMLGGVDVVRNLVENELRVAVLEKLLEVAVQRTGVRISAAEMEQFRQEAFRALETKYPNLGLTWEPGPQR